MGITRGNIVEYRVRGKCPACSVTEYNPDMTRKVPGILLVDRGNGGKPVLQCSKCQFRTRVSGKDKLEANKLLESSSGRLTKTIKDKFNDKLQ